MLFCICRRRSRYVTHSNAFDRWCARIVVHRAPNATFPGQRRYSAQSGALAAALMGSIGSRRRTRGRRAVACSRRSSRSALKVPWNSDAVRTAVTLGRPCASRLRCWDHHVPTRQNRCGTRGRGAASQTSTDCDRLPSCWRSARGVISSSTSARSDPRSDCSRDCRPGFDQRQSNHDRAAFGCAALLVMNHGATQRRACGPYGAPRRAAASPS